MSDNDPTIPYEFRSIIDFPGYRIGPDGAVQSCWGMGSGNVLTDCWRDRRHGVLRTGYHNVGLTRDGVIHTRLVHRLVLEAFVGPCPPGMECRHLDGDRGNNWVWNLAWGTSTENKADMLRHGTRNRGDRNGQAKLTETDVPEIVCLYESGLTQKEIAARYGVAPGRIHSVLTGKTWCHILRRIFSAHEVALPRFEPLKRFALKRNDLG